MAEMEYSSLEECPWQQLEIKEHSFIVKCFKNRFSCVVVCSDFKTTWCETLDAFAVMNKNARLNPSIETSVDRLLQHVISLLTNKQDAEETATSKPTLSVVTKSENELKIVTESQLCGLAFSWEFILSRRHDDLLITQLVKPLISMVVEMSRRQQELIKILAHKDAQIADYKAEGFKIPTRHKHQEPFDQKRFHKNMAQSEAFQALAAMSTGVISNPDLQCLYRSIMSVRNQHEHHLSLKVDCDEEMSKEQQSNETGSQVTAKTVIISNKELELERRRALQNRLAEERTKKENQNKNKKLKL